MEDQPVVTGFLHNRGDVLLVKRSNAVGSYPGLWGGVAGHACGVPSNAIRREIREETGIDPVESCDLVRAGEPFHVPDPKLDTRWIVHPFRFDCETRNVVTNWESETYEWVPPTEILRRETVPKLWGSYDTVRPTVETVATDTDHGATYISYRALDVLRDEAALRHESVDKFQDSIDIVADSLRKARPSMTAVRNRINRVMAACGDGESFAPAAIEATARDEIDRADGMDRATVSALADEIDGKRVATVSRSGTVLQALLAGEVSAVLVAQSRPGGEGASVAATLEDEVDVTLTSDAAFGSELVEWGADVLVFGADTILPNGDVLNKVGSRTWAIVADHEGISVLVGTSSDKIAHDRRIDVEPRPPEELSVNSPLVEIVNPTFDVTPAGLVSSYITERGAITREDIRNIASEHEENDRKATNRYVRSGG